MKPILTYSKPYDLFAWKAFTPEECQPAKSAQFWFHNRGAFVTASKYKALRLIDYANSEAIKMLLPLEDMIEASRFTSINADFPAPPGCAYRDFQKVAIWYASHFNSVLIADSMGLGKTIEAIGVCNNENLVKNLYICPAALRHNWIIEYKIWTLDPKPIQVIRDGNQILNPELSTIISYNLAVEYADQLMNMNFDALICDESQYLKNGTADRTRTVLGIGKTPGLISRAKKQIFLSGTPIKNRTIDLHHLLIRVKPEIIDHKSYPQFRNQWCNWQETEYGIQITGSRNEADLNRRLRSSFMIRRSKESVLPELPPKQYNLVVFPAEGKQIKTILKKEEQFSPDEIIKHGVPVGSALPEIRHELGLEMVPLALNYVSDLLDGGVDKILLFGYHRDVLAMVSDRFKKLGINHVMIRGGDSDKKRETAVYRFQNEPDLPVYLANMQAGGIGLNLTAAAEVILIEPSPNPDDNEQCIDRAHRIGQLRGVNAHLLVIEGTIGAKILARSVKKQIDANNVLN